VPSPMQVMAVSAREGQGVPELVSWAKQRLPYGPSLYPRDVLSEHPERFFIAEIVREQLFLQYRQVRHCAPYPLAC
jgi:GTP-binding protein Era